MALEVAAGPSAMISRLDKHVDTVEWKRIQAYHSPIVVFNDSRHLQSVAVTSAVGCSANHIACHGARLKSPFGGTKCEDQPA
jgi:hypothetical protein